ncbi:PWWP domain-containing DNA repair factor 3A [Kryptolebias marmoratus]|uniref:PWWP domain-containing protein MUM1-like n=1 Tax=Kryptolebias marmoratus TaxID=37003 RepID=A0A3Q3BB68_KRYMA|nr:PWWP domain-containing DNA repair factor 3A [Kryptolebias marmoratus]
MKGGRRQTRKREPKVSKEDVVTNSIPSPAAVESVVASSDDLSTSIQSTPRRGKRQSGRIRNVSLTSTPVHSSAADHVSNISHLSPQINDSQQEHTVIITKPKMSKANSPPSNSKSQGRRRATCSSKPRQVAQDVAKEQTELNGATVKRQRGRPRKVETVNLKDETTAQSIKRSRPRFELQKLDASEQDESLLSSDLSIELSHYEEQLPCLSFQKDENSDEEEEEELPSFLMQDKKPSSITDGAFVWCKFRNYPYWPAWVKSVNRKQKKASIIFVDHAFTGIQRNKGFALALKSMKPFDCEEADELMRKAKETYDTAVTWSLELIEDYRIRIACGSFSGSFIEYFNHDMSYPVRRKFPQTASERLTIATDTIIEDLCDDHNEYRLIEKEEDVCTSTKRLLPDRTHAAHNRANEKLVHFIVKQRMVEAHLLAVIGGQQQSRWLHAFLSAKRRRVVNTYLEDDQQLDQVYWYLDELYATTVAKSPCLAEVKQMERVPFVLDVLLPEAIIYAIAGVDNVSVKKAEEKYLKGRCISNRERQEFDLMIERQMKRKRCQNTALGLNSDPIS